MKENEFKPYIPAEKITSEFTVTSIVIGVLLAVIFGAANAYLGLRVGMTVSASIPAAVISMGVIRLIMKKDSILESNMVQTIGSAGESLAAGAIFTLPALFLWANEGKSEAPSLLSISLIALVGGILGVLFMVPLRNALIVREHGVLPYPEGTACAEVLLAGEKGGAGAGTVFWGMGLAAVFKFLIDGVKIASGVLEIPVNFMKTVFSTQVYPALLSVGYICGIKISSYLFAGGVIGWFVLIPMIAIFGGSTVLYPAEVPIAQMYEQGGAEAIWDSYIRYIGAGAVAAGGIISLVKALPLIFTTFRDSIKGLKSGTKAGNLRTQQDLDIRFVLGGIVVLLFALWLLPAIPVSFVGAILIIVFGFFFATVSSRMVGLVGSSNNPVSGMAIATLLFSTLVLKMSGADGMNGMIGAIAIGSVICIVAAMAGDTSQDLKTGYILGATPKKQQIGELIGAVVSAFTIGIVLLLLNQAWGFGTEELAAPQATLMRMITEGVMGGNLPWGLILIGVFVAVVIEILGIPVLPVAIGLYLPLNLSTAIMIGGILRWVIDWKFSGKNKEGDAGRGVLFCSGLIAGEGLVGILLAILAVVGIADRIDLSHICNSGWLGGIVLLIAIIACILFFARPERNGTDE